ncbi:MAG TPA: flagellar protein export ATPase FliI [Chthonomonadales bacterium]|nr:flagellar protein export ATPase FliI [Chthonomonadales bacterium]
MLLKPRDLEPPAVDLERYRAHLERFDPVKVNGRVAQVVGLVIEALGPNTMVGEICEIRPDRMAPPVPAEVVGFRDNRVLLMPLGDMERIRPGSEVVATRSTHEVGVGPALLGRVLDGLGRPMDDLGPVDPSASYAVNAAAPNSLRRTRISRPLPLGVRAVDGFLTVGQGQRLGIFAGSGVGKSTLLGMIARNTAADVNVIALTGERGREVRDFIEESLGEEGLRRSVVVVATSDQPALIRIKAALIATAIAEFFRDQGSQVLLMMDSVTRLAMAQREVGLAIGEPPTTRGYTPSVFALLPRLLERAGTSDRGSITGLYTVLVEGDDMNEPVADAVRSILDGHVVLSRALAHQNHYPAIDVLQSVSRVMPAVTTASHRASAGDLRSLLATYRDAEDLINIGAYVDGSNMQIDRARRHIAAIRAFLRQDTDDACGYEATVDRILALHAAASSGAAPEP